MIVTQVRLVWGYAGQVVPIAGARCCVKLCHTYCAFDIQMEYMGHANTLMIQGPLGPYGRGEKGAGVVRSLPIQGR